MIPRAFQPDDSAKTRPVEGVVKASGPVPPGSGKDSAEASRCAKPTPQSLTTSSAEAVFLLSHLLMNSDESPRLFIHRRGGGRESHSPLEAVRSKETTSRRQPGTSGEIFSSGLAGFKKKTSLIRRVSSDCCSYRLAENSDWKPSYNE